MTERQGYVDAANQALGVLAAKHRGDEGDVKLLLESFQDDGTMASGFILAAELLLGQLTMVSGWTVEQVLRETALLVEANYPDPPA